MTWVPIIPRLVHKEVESAGSRIVTVGLFGDTLKIDLYKANTIGLIVQNPDTIEVFLTSNNDVFRVERGMWPSYCRWHSGPLGVRDNPVKRIYCNLPAEDYCRQHRKTERAFYDLCVTLRGETGLQYCRLLDKLVKTEYVVYLTDFGGARPKVGITRRFRFLDRITEQAHITATILAVVDSAVKARKFETELSRIGIAQEMHRKNYYKNRSLGESASLLVRWAERASKALGLKWKEKIYRVEPPRDLPQYLSLRSPQTLGESFKVKGYWGGFLLVETEGGSRYRIRFRLLQHRRSLSVMY